MNTKKILCVIIALEVIFLIICGCIYIKKEGVFIPSYARWHKCNDDYTLCGENVNFKVKSRKLTITSSDGMILYQTEKDIKVSDAFCTDIDHDGTLEVILMIWKRGSYGDHMPFWVEEDTDRWTQHIFIYEWDVARGDRLDPKWMSSEIGIHITQITADDDSNLHLIDDTGKETICSWESWGLIYK